MNVVGYVKFLLIEEIYSIVTAIYLVKLNKLNKVLSSERFDESIRLLAYNNWEPMKYFVIALCLFVLGGCIILRRVNYVRFKKLYFGEMVSVLVAVMIMLILLILLFIFINNPILRAIFAALSVGTVLLFKKRNGEKV